MFLSPKKRIASFRDRIGFGKIPRLQKPIWIHAVSVGEVLSVKNLMAHLKRQLPDTPLVLSTITATGQHIAQGGAMDGLIYFPFDIGFSIQRVLDRVDPRMVVIVETEIWPNFIRACFQKKIPVIGVNGRISDQSYPRYRWIRFFLKGVLRQYTVIAMQSAEDCRRMISLGADPTRVFSMGNLKYDMDPRSQSLPETLKAALRAPSPLWVAASTMAGEEEMILDALSRLIKRHPGLRLLIAPRHPERFDDVARLLTKRGWAYTRRSRLSGEVGEGRIILLDSLGELAAIFEFADLVFVGGSLIPHGGHNILEPAFYKKPIMFGPHMENFREIAERFLREDAAVEVRSVSEMVESVDLFLSNKARASQWGENAKKIVDAHSGTTQKIVALISEIIQKSKESREAA